MSVRVMNSLAALCATFAVLVVIGGVLLWLAQRPYFALRGIEIRGDLQHVTSASVRAAIAGRLKGNFFTMRNDETRRLLETVPWVAQAPQPRATASPVSAAALPVKPAAPRAEDREVAPAAAPAPAPEPALPPRQTAPAALPTEAPIGKAAAPIVKADTPIVKADTPTAKVDTPMAKVDTPIVKEIVARKGDTLAALIVNVYGRVDHTLLDVVQRANPGIVDVDVIEVGRHVRFPTLDASSALAASGEFGVSDSWWNSSRRFVRNSSRSRARATSVPARPTRSCSMVYLTG
jgi:phage tail protein X